MTLIAATDFGSLTILKQVQQNSLYTSTAVSKTLFSRGSPFLWNVQSFGVNIPAAVDLAHNTSSVLSVSVADYEFFPD